MSRLEWHSNILCSSRFTDANLYWVVYASWGRGDILGQRRARNESDRHDLSTLSAFIGKDIDSGEYRTASLVDKVPPRSTKLSHKLPPPITYILKIL